MVYVIKANGEKEEFNSNKIKKSVMEAGGSKELAENIARRVERKKYENIPTERILDITLNGLKREKGVANRYDLKRAIMRLGPSGFPFEKFFSLILKEYGYEKIKVGMSMQGKYVFHEIDVDATKDKRYMIECKYHNKLGIHTRVKVALYIYARFLDLKHIYDKPWIVTNTKCSEDVKKYANGVGMNVTSWDYPKGLSLSEMIKEKNLFPITVLSVMNERIKERLFKGNIFLVKTILEKDIVDLRNRTNLPDRLLYRLKRDAEVILGV